MKFLILSILICLSIFSAQSQLTKNNWLVGGSGRYYSNNETYTNANSVIELKNTDIFLSAPIGYFIVDKFAIGLKPAFSIYKSDDTGNSIGASGGHSNNTKFAIGPFARYYFLDKDKQFNILTDISYQFGVNKWSNTKGKISSFALMAGPEIFFNSVVGIEVLIGYSIQKETIDDLQFRFDDTKKGFLTSIGFQIHLEKL